MRMRMLLVAVSASPLARCCSSPAPRRRRSSRPSTDAEKLPEAEQGVHRDASRTRRARSTTARRRRPRSCPRRTSSSGARSRSSCCFVPAVEVRVPGLKKSMDTRTERIRNDLEAAENAKTEAEHDARRVPGAARRRSQRVGSHHRGGAPAGRRAPARSGAAAADRARRHARARAAADIDAAKAQAIADLRREVAALSIGAAEVVVERNLDADTQPQLVENYINQVGSRN